MNKISLAVLILLAALCLALPATAASPVTMEAAVGYGGYYKIGEWIPVRVEIRNDGADLNGEVQVDGVTENGLRTVYTRPVSLPARSQKALFVYTLHTGFVHEIEVRLVQGSETIALKKANAEPAPDSTYLVGVVAEEPYPNAAVSAISVSDNRRTVRSARLSVDSIPSRVQALRSLDAIVLNNAATGNLSREQREALSAWVNMGGQLVVATGPNWQKTTEGIADLLPGRINGTRTVEALPGLESYAGQTVRGVGPFVVAVAEPQNNGSVLADQDGLPLLLESRIGDGRVDLLALDLGLEPLSSWNGTSGFWKRLLVPRASMVTAEAQVRRGNPMGGPPISYSLSNIPAMDLPSAKWLALFLGVYILCIGPLNYSALKRLDRREWAWFTVPALTLLFSVGAYLIGFQAKGSDVIVSTISIERINASGEPTTMESYFGLFSPSRQSYDVELPGDVMVSSIPHWGPWGGGGSLPPAVKVQQGESTLVRDVSVDMWSMRAFMAELPRGQGARPIVADLRSEGDRIVGMISNADSQPLQDAVLVHGSRVARMGTLAPGESRAVDLDIRRQSVDSESQWWSMSMRILGQDTVQSGPNPMPPDRERMRRQSILDSIFGYGKGGSPEESLDAASGLSLVAWRETDSLELEVKGYTMSRSSTALLIAELPVEFGSGQLTVPPGFLSRSVVQSDVRNFSTTPFGFFLDDGEVTFNYQLPPGTERMKVDQLTLYFNVLNRSKTSTSATVDISVFDWSRQEWTTIDDVSPGDGRSLENPEHYVNESGAIRLKLVSSSRSGPIEVSELDFSVRGRQ